MTHLQGVYVNVFDHAIDVYATNGAHIQLPGSLLKVEGFAPEDAVHQSCGGLIGPLEFAVPNRAIGPEYLCCEQEIANKAEQLLHCRIFWRN